MAQARTSKETLYKPENLPLWHPEHRLEPNPHLQGPYRQPVSISAPSTQPTTSPEIAETQP
jgi:hypothetical protein